MRNRIGKILVDIAFFRTAHVHIDDHHAVPFQVVFYKCKKLHGRHLKGDCNILISIYHNHIIFMIRCLQICTPVIIRYRNVRRKREIVSCKRGDLFINLHAFRLDIWKIPHTLGCKCPGAHAKHKHVHRILFIDACHKRRRQRIVIIHPGQAVVLF